MISTRLYETALRNTRFGFPNELSQVHTRFLSQLSQFIESSSHFLSIEVSGVDETQAVDALGFVESKVVSLLHHAHQVNDCTVDGVWSTPFSFKGWHSPSTQTDEGEDMYGGFLLLAVSLQTHSDGTDSCPPALQQCLNECIAMPFNELYASLQVSLNCAIVEKAKITKRG